MNNFFNRLLTLLARIFSINFLLTVVKLPSAILLVVVNLIPIFGVLFWGWNPYDIVLLYWVENIVIGIFNFFRIRLAKGEIKFANKLDAERVIDKNDPSLTSYLSFFFLIPYGLFSFGHAFFLMYFFAPKASFILDRDYLGFIIFFIALMISHGFSYFYNYVKKEEYLHQNPDELMHSPYLRIAVTHTSVILGGLVASIAPELIIILFVILKTVFDLLWHMGEHGDNQNSSGKKEIS